MTFKIAIKLEITDPHLRNILIKVNNGIRPHNESAFRLTFFTIFTKSPTNTPKLRSSK